MSTATWQQEWYIQDGEEQYMTPIPTAKTTPAPTTTPATPVAGTAWGTTNATFATMWWTKPTTTTPVEPSYTDDSDKRLKEIQANLKNYEKTAPQLFEDRDAFNRAFSYEKRSDAQKAILDSYYGSYQQRTQQIVPVETDYSYLNNIDYLTQNWITTEEKNWLTQNNPALLDEYNNYMKEQATLNNINLDVGAETNIMDMVQNMFGTVDTPDLMAQQQQLMSEYGVEDLQKDYNQKKAKVLEIQNLMSNKLSEVRKRYEGTWATEGFIRAMAAKENTYLQQELDDAQVSYGLAGDDLNDAISNVNNTLELSQAQYSIDRQAMNDKMAQAWFVMDLMSFETPAQKDERERNNRLRQQEYTEGNINSTDPAIRRRAVTNAVDRVLAEFEWIPMVRSRDQMVADIQKLVDGGMELWQAITQNIRNPIMKKDEYKLRAANKLWVSDYATVWGYNVNFNEDWTMRLTQNTSYSGWYTANYTPVSQDKLSSALNQVMYQWDGSTWGQCGSFVNDYLQDMWLWRLFTDPIDRKKAVANTSTPTVWSVAIMDSNVAPEYGHVGIVTAVNGDWTVTIKNSNRNGDGKVTTNKVKQSSIYGYFDPRIWWASSMQNSATETPYDKLYKAFNESDGTKSPTESELKSMGMTYNQFVRNAYDYGKRAPVSEQRITDDQLKVIQQVSTDFENEPLVKEYNTVNSQVSYLNSFPVNTTNPWDDIALIYGMAKVLDPTSVVREGEYNTIQKYAQSFPKKIRSEIKQAWSGKWFLSESARQAIKDTLNRKLKAQEWMIMNLMQQKANQINVRAWITNGMDYLINYSSLSPVQPTDTTSTTPQYTFTTNPVTTATQSNGYYTFTLGNWQTISR